MDTHWYAWAAGIIDGEGTYHHHISKTGRSWHIRLSVPQATFVEGEPPEMLTRLQEMFGGSIFQKKVEPERRQMWAWSVHSRESVRTVTDLIWPWLGPPKREQFERAWEKVTFINKSPSPRVYTICARCGKEQLTAPSARRKYCGTECSRSSRGRNAMTGQFI